MPHLFKKYGAEFINENMMGPNSMRIAEEITKHIKLKSGMRVLDLGCGKALSSVYLASEYDIMVYAADLWVPATEIYEKIRLKNLEKRVIPIQADARLLPFAAEYFDAVISIHAYHYFGTDETYLSNVLLRYVKSGGNIVIAVPGLKDEFEKKIPEDLKDFCAGNDFLTFHSHKWWRNMFDRVRLVKVLKSFDLQCTEDAWDDWLVSNNPAAEGDRHFYEIMKDHFATPAVIAVKK